MHPCTGRKFSKGVSLPWVVHPRISQSSPKYVLVWASCLNVLVLLALCVGVGWEEVKRGAMDILSRFRTKTALLPIICKFSKAIYWYLTDGAKWHLEVTHLAIWVLLMATVNCSTKECLHLTRCCEKPEGDPRWVYLYIPIYAVFPIA